MKRIGKFLIGLCFIIAGGFLSLFFLKAEPFNNIPLYLSIIIAIVVFVTLIANTFTNDNVITKEQRKAIMFTSLFELNGENDTEDLRLIRAMVNKKLKYSRKNKNMIQASKELCGKNCKCSELRKQNLCNKCGVYKAYVEYLQEHTDDKE
jgi:hypothetical protein